MIVEKLELPRTLRELRIVEVETVVLLKAKLPTLSDFGIYTVEESVFTPIPSRYLELKAYGVAVILFLGVRVSDPTLTSRYTEVLLEKMAGSRGLVLVSPRFMLNSPCEGVVLTAAGEPIVPLAVYKIFPEVAASYKTKVMS